MTDKEQIPEARARLSDELLRLERLAKTSRSGLTRSTVVTEINRSRPRGSEKLASSTVGEWFTKGVPPKEFAPLWSVVSTLLKYDRTLPTYHLDHPAWKRHRAEWQRYWRAAKSESPAQKSTAPDADDLTVGSPIALPHEPTGFVGRINTITKLLAVLDPESGSHHAAVVVGMPGVGKSALALRVAHEAIRGRRFPGGALYADLNGYGADARVNTDDALGIMLYTLGVKADGIPPTRTGRSALYRSELARLPGPALIVIDNVTTASEVTPLLPGLGGHRVLATSRHSLSTLSAHHVELNVLTAAQSVELIDTALRLADRHDTRVSESPEQAGRMVRLCGSLPLALHIAAALLKNDRHSPLARLTEKLESEKNLLKRLKYPDDSQLGVEAAFRVSYRLLPKPQQQLLRRLSSNPRYPVDEKSRRAYRALSVPLKPYLTTSGAAYLGDSTPIETRPLLLALNRAHLLEHEVWGRAIPKERWRMHDLVLLFAAKKAHKKAGVDNTGETVLRFLLYCLKAESPQKATIEVIGDGEALFSLAYDEQLGTEVITPATPHPDLPLDLLLPGFTRHEEKNAWVNPEPNDRLRDAWEADERRRWGAGYVSDAEIVGHDEDDAGTER